MRSIGCDMRHRVGAHDRYSERMAQVPFRISAILGYPVFEALGRLAMAYTARPFPMRMPSTKYAVQSP